GKKRWVGVEFESGATSNRQLIRSLSEDLDTVEIAWVSDNEKTLILGVKLQEYQELKKKIDEAAGVRSLTSSGKIRLVKSRLSSFRN
ncbi:MAG: hypothetical protein VXZ65_05615, partial [Candidatus Thermoplasmatota archaeon]|nr:hypothetical protein [Candidatus Thermoplasmatota archaeon]